IDPECAIGILEQFEREHPEFGHAASFYVLPGASPPNRLFNQPDLVGKKLAYLKSRGYEIGNHTLWHANLAKYDEPTVRKQLLESQEWVQRHLPGYRFRTLALPMGSYPRELAWAISGRAAPRRRRTRGVSIPITCPGSRRPRPSSTTGSAISTLAPMSVMSATGTRSPSRCPAARPRRCGRWEASRSSSVDEGGRRSVDEIRRAALEEAGPVGVGPAPDARQRLLPQEGPDSRAVHQQVLDGRRAEAGRGALHQLGGECGPQPR